MHSFETESSHSGFFFLYKPVGMTSFDIVKRIHSSLGKSRKVGHTGTLDRMAEGLLVIPFGDYTCFSQIFLQKEKTYFSEVEFGVSTDSTDVDGEVLETWEETRVLDFLENLGGLDQMRKEFLKVQETRFQIPPLISATKVQGQRSSDLFRKGVMASKPPKPIQIYSLELVEMTTKGFSFRTCVTGGAYIRGIVADFSKTLGLPMHITKLVREKVGDLHVRDSDKAEQIFEKSLRVKNLEMVYPLQEVVLDPKDSEFLRNGGYPPIEFDNMPEVYAITTSGERIAWLGKNPPTHHLPYKIKKVFSFKKSFS